MAADILIVIEGAQPTPAAAELVTAARRIAPGCGGRIALLACGADTATAAWQALGIERLYRLACEPDSEPLAETLVSAATEAARHAAPALVVAAHTPLGAEAAPRLAFRLGGAAATGCTELAWTDGGLRCTRPCYGGIAREVSTFAASPLVATVRAGVYARAEPAPSGAVEVIELGTSAAHAARTRRIQRRLEAPEGLRLEDARVIVAGGRGLEGPAGFELLAELARVLGGAVGASRVPCDLGWVPHSWQIGLTGKTVTPELYVAVGISGAGHHMAGCGNAGTIAAINSDPEAAIFQDARFGVVGDYREVLPALIDAARALAADSPAKP
jgi:electron transfer flavoprotein alpha subunit